MIAIAFDAGNCGATVDAPSRQPIIREILNLSHPPNPSPAQRDPRAKTVTSMRRYSLRLPVET
jgi:hypothetical protein